MDTQTSDERRLEERDDRRRPLSREAYALLAQANLLRMRGEWPDSIEKCMAALRLSPDNPSAQSLLGDIYENQGRLDDAIQWYRMALDVQPDSPADRIKLTRLLDLKARDLSTPVLLKCEDAAPSGTASPSPLRPDWLSRWHSHPDVMLRRFASVAGALAVLVVLTALILAHRSLSFGSPLKQVSAPPVVVPSVATSPSVTASPEAASADVADPSEVAILNSLRAATTITAQGYTVDAVQIDPRTGRLTLTMSCLPPAGATPHRDFVLRGATSVLQASVQQTDPQVVTQFTVRCLLASPTGGSTPLIFTADATRSAIAALNPNLTLLSDDQIATAYTNPWWASALAQ